MVEVSSEMVRGVSGVIRACFSRYVFASFIEKGGELDVGGVLVVGVVSGDGGDRVGVGPLV